MAEIGGFEPSIQFPVYAISSRAHSTSSAISPKSEVIIYMQNKKSNYLLLLCFFEFLPFDFWYVCAYNNAYETFL